MQHLPSDNVLACPAAPELECGYAFNAAVDGLPRRALDRPSDLIIIFESDAGWNAAGGPELLPDEPRHLGSDNYGFADGHAQWIKRRKNPDGTWSKEPVGDWVIWEPVLKESDVGETGTSSGSTASE